MLETPIGIDLWIDINSPRCYLTVIALRKALSIFSRGDDFQLIVHPYFSGSSESWSDEDQTLADSLGVPLNPEAPRAATTKPAQMMIASAQQSDYEGEANVGPDTLHLRVAEAIMRAQFELGLDVDDRDTLIGIGQDLGIPAESTIAALTSDITESAVEEGHNLALYLGVEEVPVILIDEQFVAEGGQTPKNYTAIFTTVVEQYGKDDE